MRIVSKFIQYASLEHLAGEGSFNYSLSYKIYHKVYTGVYILQSPILLPVKYSLLFLIQIGETSFQGRKRFSEKHR